MPFSRLSFLLSVVSLSGLLTACAVTKQGNTYQIGIDRNELLSQDLQEFRLGTSKGVLRIGPQGGLQIKLYDRMKVLDLGSQVISAYVTYALQFGRQDVLIVHTPTATCPHAYQVFQLTGYAVNMWEMNTVPGRCQAPLVFSTDAQGWTAREDRDQGVRQRWMWSNGRLTGGTELAPANAMVSAPASAVPNGAPVAKAPSVSPIASARAERPHARFESGDAEVAATRAPRQADRDAATPAAAPAKTGTAQKHVANAPKPISVGSYNKLPGTAETEIAPVKITLHDGV